MHKAKTLIISKTISVNMKPGNDNIHMKKTVDSTCAINFLKKKQTNKVCAVTDINLRGKSLGNVLPFYVSI